MTNTVQNKVKRSVGIFLTCRFNKDFKLIFEIQVSLMLPNGKDLQLNYGEGKPRMHFMHNCKCTITISPITITNSNARRMHNFLLCVYLMQLHYIQYTIKDDQSKE